MVQREKRARKEPKEQWVSQEVRDPKGRWDHEDQLDQEVRKDGLVEWVATVPLDYPEQMVPMEDQEKTENQDLQGNRGQWEVKVSKENEGQRDHLDHEG